MTCAWSPQARGHLVGWPGPSPLRVWISGEPLRACPHLDFGTRWVDSARPERHHRVSWIPTTGELYVTDPVESYVRVLGVVQDRARLATLLTGWGTVGARTVAPLSWIVDRIAEAEADIASEPGTEAGDPEAGGDTAGAGPGGDRRPDVRDRPQPTH